MTEEAGPPAERVAQSPAAALRRFTDWAASLEVDALPDRVVTRLKQSVRDGLGCAIFCSALPWTRMVADTMVEESGGHGPATIWGDGRPVGLMAAAVANGTAIQSYELDDFHSGASIHGASTMLPATLGLAEARPGVTGTDLLCALAAGWEGAVRVSRCIGNILVKGWHSPTMMGAIAASVAAGRVLRLSSDQMYHCVSLGLLQASGISVVQYGGMAKRIYAGKAAEVGIQSALLAERGITAPADVFGEEFGGFVSTFAPDVRPDVDALTSSLSEQFAVDGVSFKLYSCAAMIHPAIDLVAGFVESESGVTASAVERVAVEMTEHGYKHCGFPYVPDTPVTAQFSVGYCLAAYLVEGAVFVDQFREELLTDQRVLDLVARTEITMSPTLQTADPRSKRTVVVRLELRDGRVLEGESMFARGQSDRPASDVQLRSKFDRLVVDVLGPAAGAKLSDTVQRLDSLERVADLVALMRTPTLSDK